MEYLDEVHAARLLRMLENEHVCTSCPSPTLSTKIACPVCLNFLGMDEDIYCPCIELGKHEAVKRTWIALEEKGYI